MAKNITETIRKIAEQNMPVVVSGRVLEVNPLKVQLVDDLNILLSAQSMIIPSGKLPLAVGEQLYFLAVNRGKIYYLLDRE